VDRVAAQRILGSTAFVAMARVVWQTASAGEDMMALGVTKSNLSMKPPALLWSRREDGPMTWHDESDKSIDELMRGGGAPRPGQAAKEFLLEFLADGPRQASEVEEAALALGIAKRTLARAREVVGVEAFKEHTAHGKWLCQLPGIEPAAEHEAMNDMDAAKASNSNVVDLATLASFRNMEAS
jgi:hypothetical protein